MQPSRADSPTTASPIAYPPPRTKSIHHVQMNDMPAGQEQMASMQQARCLGPPYSTTRTPRAWCYGTCGWYGVLVIGTGCTLHLAARCLLTSLLPANQPRRLWPQQACQTSPPRDIPQQPSSQLVAGEELGADSIKDDAQIAPAKATPQPLVHRQHRATCSLDC